MRSGEPGINRKHEYYQSRYNDVIDKYFNKLKFKPIAALVSKELINGYRMSKPYNGEPYDQDKFYIVEGIWDHEHCSICNFKILSEYTYWSNDKAIVLLCDECHDFFAA